MDDITTKFGGPVPTQPPTNIFSEYATRFATYRGTFGDLYYQRNPGAAILGHDPEFVNIDKGDVILRARMKARWKSPTFHVITKGKEGTPEVEEIYDDFDGDGIVDAYRKVPNSEVNLKRLPESTRQTVVDAHQKTCVDGLRELLEFMDLEAAKIAGIKK